MNRLEELIRLLRVARYSGCRVDELKYEREVDAALTALHEEIERGTP